MMILVKSVIKLQRIGGLEIKSENPPIIKQNTINSGATVMSPLTIFNN